MVEDGLDLDGVLVVVFEGAREEVVGWARLEGMAWRVVVVKRCLPDRRPPRYLMVVSNRDTSVLVVLKSTVWTCLRIWSTTSHFSITSAVLKASTALAPQPFLGGNAGQHHHHHQGRHRQRSTHLSSS